MKSWQTGRLALFVAAFMAGGFTGIGLYNAGYHQGFEFRDEVAHVQMLLVIANNADPHFRMADSPNTPFCSQAEWARQQLAPLITHKGANESGYYDPAIAYELKQYDESCQWELNHQARHKFPPSK